MHFARTTAIVGAIATCALANPLPEAQSTSKQSLSNNCKLGDAGGIRSPQHLAAVDGKSLDLVFCSGEYFKTSTKSIDVVMLNGASDGGSGITIAKGLKPTTVSGYDKKFAFNPQDYSTPESKEWTLLVYEHHTSYGGATDDTWTTYAQRIILE